MPALTMAMTVTAAAAVSKVMVWPRETSTRARLGYTTQHEETLPKVFWPVGDWLAVMAAGCLRMHWKLG